MNRLRVTIAGWMVTAGASATQGGIRNARSGQCLRNLKQRGKSHSRGPQVTPSAGMTVLMRLEEEKMVKLKFRQFDGYADVETVATYESLNIVDSVIENIRDKVDVEVVVTLPPLNTEEQSDD